MNRKILSIIVLAIALISTASALRQVAGPLEIDSCPGKMNHAIYGLIPDVNQTQEVLLKAEGDIKDYIYFPERAVLQPNLVNYVVVIDKFENMPKENTLYGQNITGFIYAEEQTQTCSGCAKLNVELKKQVTINVCKKNSFTFFDFFKKIFGKA